jgi:hypothetical protein
LLAIYWCTEKHAVCNLICGREENSFLQKTLRYRKNIYLETLWNRDSFLKCSFVIMKASYISDNVCYRSNDTQKHSFDALIVKPFEYLPTIYRVILWIENKLRLKLISINQLKGDFYTYAITKFCTGEWNLWNYIITRYHTNEFSKGNTLLERQLCSRSRKSEKCFVSVYHVWSVLIDISLISICELQLRGTVSK